MARTPVQQLRAMSLVARRVRVAVPTEGAITDRQDRMARFAAGAGQVIARAVAVGALVAAGWLLALLFGMLTAAPAAADTSHATVAAGPVSGDFPTAGDAVSVTDNAEAMAGLKVDGLTSQSTPGMPDPSTASKNLGANGLAPNGGGSGPFGPSMGDVARSVFDPRLLAQRAPLACVLPPVVRTAADDPSFSPD
ncbi:hypothetical protein [Nonomuraea endophytica]|uniref:Uncharacterized protein n=1 Tax=Nonomuraea endophytica TaxID=714136 RepID=A0A7W8AB07_9ACTN|nr:hypothetical protein [Nonomuraea endophytica]MBB5082889.1 hypothetical protein [Nonomuraea endophytica]